LVSSFATRTLKRQADPPHNSTSFIASWYLLSKSPSNAMCWYILIGVTIKPRGHNEQGEPLYTFYVSKTQENHDGGTKIGETEATDGYHNPRRQTSVPP
jgi:hypothetical protein